MYKTVQMVRHQDGMAHMYFAFSYAMNLQKNRATGLYYFLSILMFRENIYRFIPDDTDAYLKALQSYPDTDTSTLQNFKTNRKV